MAEDRVAVASYGFGGIVQNRHLEGIENSQYCRFVGAFEPHLSEEGAGRLASAGAKLYELEQQILDDPEVQIVLVASPHHFHSIQTGYILNAGKHAFVEKPLGTSYNAVEPLAKTADAAGLGLVVNSMMRQHWAHKEADRLVREGTIGKVMRVETSMEFPYDDFKGFRYTETDENGGGAAWDVGPHCLYMGMMLAGANAIDRISGEFGRQISPDIKDPHQSLYITYVMTNGVIGHANTSFTTHMDGCQDLLFRVIGTEGRIEGYGTMFQHSAPIPDNDLHLMVHTSEGVRRVPENPTAAASIPWGNIYSAEFDRLAEPIVKGQTPPVDWDAVGITGAVQAALVSAKKRGQPIEIRHMFKQQ